jgi:dipeptidyl aminopeptidase/acylaminoacyl peptidase
MQPQDAPKKHSLSLVIFNRGGGLEYGKLTASIVVNMLHPLMRNFPCLLLASNYRGNDAGRNNDTKKGKEDYGDADLNDIHALIEIGKRSPLWDGNVFMVGWSSGGMRTYKVSKQRMILPLPQSLRALLILPR